MHAKTESGNRNWTNRKDAKIVLKPMRVTTNMNTIMNTPEGTSISNTELENAKSKVANTAVCYSRDSPHRLLTLDNINVCEI